jgi:small-conductance mechanosensitive channel
VTFDQLRTRLSDLQSRLVPLESQNGGVVDLLGQVQDIRDRLVAKIGALEADENGDLASRVRMFAATKEELEQRVATVTEQFSKLATIRSDISGLFDKLSNVADASSN